MILGLMVWMEELDLFHNFGGKTVASLNAKMMSDAMWMTRL